MKQYVDIFNKPLDKDEVTKCISIMASKSGGNTTVSIIGHDLRVGPGKASRIVELLQDAGVLGPPNRYGNIKVILKNESAAKNTALRQLKKGKK